MTYCKNEIHTGGYICGTHRYRFKIYGCYDLPDHEGEPSILNVPEKPGWAAGHCKVHGPLRENQMYFSSTRKGKYSTKGCRRCAISRNIKKTKGLEGGLDEYEKIATENGNQCAICKEEKLVYTQDKTQKRTLFVDHCHKTGKFRGILCLKCNSGLGYFQDNPEHLQAAIEYLKKD